jgi:hypothetical protein
MLSITHGSSATTTIPARELDARRGDGLDVRLLWNPADDSLSVTVDDHRSGERFVIPVATADAAEAFAHPFAYAAAPVRRRRSVPV